MTIEQIVADLTTERDRLSAAITALEDTDSVEPVYLKKPKFGSKFAPDGILTEKEIRRRKRLSRAMKRRWAARLSR